MRLNPDCIRDILLSLENLPDNGRTSFSFENFDDVREHLHLNLYSADEIEYHLRQCSMNDMLVGEKFGCDGQFVITDISPKAHEFLANIRDERQWHTVKSTLSAIRSCSLSAISSIAEGVTASAISAYFSGRTGH